MKFLRLKKAADKEYSIHYWSEKECEMDSDPHTYKVLKDKKQAIELAKELFKKMNYKGLVTVDNGDYSYYSTDNYDWDKITKFDSKDYKKGYKDGKNAYEIGHPADPDDLEDDFTEEYIKGYWQGFNDAQEKEFYKQSSNYYKFRNDLPEYQPADIKVGQEVWFDTDEVADNENNLDIVKEIEDHGIVKEIKKWPYGNREYYMVEVNDGIIVEVGTVYDSEEKRDLARNRSFSEKFESISKESAIQQPNKPKPTTMLPDNMEWSWDPEAMDWVAVLKDNTNVTPPLYNPNNNQTITNNATTYMSNVKTASSDKYEYMLLDRLIQDAKYFIEHPNLKHLWAKTLDEHIAKMKEQYTKLDPKPEWTSEDSIDELAKKMKEAYSNHWNEVHPDNKIESSLTNCLSEFLDGPRYSKEIKIEAGLIKDGLVKYAGFDFNKGTKYAITTKGLEVLRKASEAEHNEALNEREKLAYMFGFNTDEISTLDTTGKTIKSEGTKKFNVKSLINKLYSEIKKSRSHWEGIDPLEYTYIDAKDVDGGTEIQVRDELSYEGMMKLAELLNKIIKEVDPQAYFEPLEPGIMIAFISNGNDKNASKKLAKKYTICEADGCELGEVEASSELDAKVKFGIEHPEYADSLSIKAICASEDKIFSVEYTYPDSESNVWYRGSIKVKADTEEEALKIAEEKLQGADTFKISNKSYSNDDLITKDSPVKTFRMDWYYDGEKVRNEYTDSKEVESANKPFESTMGFYTYEVLWQDHDDKDGEFIEPIRFELCDDRDIDEWSWKCEELFGKEWFYGFLSKKDAMDKVIKELNKWGTIKGEIKQVDSLYTGRLKRLHSNYEQTTNTNEPYPNPSETPHDDIVLENHDGWVNTASFEDDIRKQFMKPHQPIENSNRDLNLLEEQILQLVDNDKKDEVYKLFDQLQFSDKEAAKYNYTPEQRRLLPLFKLVNEYVAKKQIKLTEDVNNEENTIATGQAEVINELEHKIKD